MDWRRLSLFVGWSVLLLVAQVIVEPAGMAAFVGQTNLGLVGQVNNLSPYAISPILWAGLAAVGLVITIRLAPTRAGWAAAVAYSVLATPRLLEYVLMTLLAGLRRLTPTESGTEDGRPARRWPWLGALRAGRAPRSTP